MSDKSSLPSFMVTRNLKNYKNYFNEAKIYKLTESVIPHQTLFHMNLAMCNLPSSMKSSSHKT